MDGHRLSDEERRALEQIETMLRQDDGLDRRLRTMRLRRIPNVTGWLRHWRPLLIVLVTVASTALMVLAVASLAPAVIAAVAATWLLTLVLTVDMVRNRRRARRERQGED
jgi:Flp pilus assembly protein TadB